MNTSEQFAPTASAPTAHPGPGWAGLHPGGSRLQAHPRPVGSRAWSAVPAGQFVPSAAVNGDPLFTQPFYSVPSWSQDWHRQRDHSRTIGIAVVAVAVITALVTGIVVIVG